MQTLGDKDDGVSRMDTGNVRNDIQNHNSTNRASNAKMPCIYILLSIFAFLLSTVVIIVILSAIREVP
ncbi:hypothetical protein X943_001705 [Babesia divergens]|uniref:Uncharacterized protein n=1 Tax=Babesia divergens TaxID=32595 RepID=A0AAD9GJI9_BABDI|nr:hypothetical protein X943_001705 [Babesia divergens]